MMHATLHIISRAMFSSDSDEIVDVVQADVNLYQSKVRPAWPNSCISAMARTPHCALPDIRDFR